MTLSDLAVLMLLFLLALALWRHMEVGQLAYRAAKRHTERMGVTLLDQSIVLKRMMLRKSKRALCAVERCYYFEFSTLGDERYSGKVIFLGREQVSVELSPHKTPSQVEPLDY